MATQTVFRVLGPGTGSARGGGMSAEDLAEVNEILGGVAAPPDPYAMATYAGSALGAMGSPPNADPLDAWNMKDHVGSAHR